MGGNEPEEILAVALTEADRREQARVEALHALGLLERPVAEGLDRVVDLAAEVCGTTSAAINIVDEEWLHAIAAVGGPRGRFPREDIPCDLVVRSGEELILPDTTAAPAVAGSPVVDGTLAAVRSYASVPLRTLAGHVVGTLCAYGEQPRPFSDQQLKMLRILAEHAIGLVQMNDAIDRARQATERLAEATAPDVSDRARRSAEELLRAAFELAPNGLAVVAATGPQMGRILRANAAVHKLSGHSDLVGLPFADVVSGSAEERRGPRRPNAEAEEIDRQALREDFSLLISQPAGTFRNDSLEHRTRMPVGPGHIFVHLLISLARDAEGRPEHALVQLRDVTTQHAHEQWLIQQTQVDSLTGLGNRLALRERLTQEIAWLRTGHGGLGVLMADLDNFRAVNDTLGRPAGDDLLCRVAAALTAALPEDAFRARLGGDQFVVLAPGGSADSLHELSDRVRAALGQAADNFAERLGVQVGASVGTLFTENPATDPDELLKAADSALYETKRKRRGGGPSGRPGLHSVPPPRGVGSPPLPLPTPAPRHTPGPGETPHPAQSRKP